mmetsp:Transcript_145404/g.378227  ORF Transcript_145404/g.378227 Transcript_145404/m.378227 type:complete len:99 (+) Transcript_145404:82-378(+)
MAWLLAMSMSSLMLPLHASVVSKVPDVALVQKRITQQRLEGPAFGDGPVAMAQLTETRALAEAVVSGRLALDSITLRAFRGMWDAMENLVADTTSTCP